MNKFAEILKTVLAFVGLGVLLVLVHAALTSSANAQEKILKPGYIPQYLPPKTPYTVTTGRITTQQGLTQDIRLKTYTYPNKTVTTGTWGDQKIRLVTPKVKSNEIPKR